jgi:3-deoxy-D-manno-octulosonic-acid transferase
VPDDALLLVAGSTHAGEEALLADISQRLRRRHPNLFLVLVPRHFERSREVGGELSSRGVRFAYRSEITSSTRHAPGSVDCLLVNTTGELRFFYTQAAVVFVGKSLLAQGGQNPIEPAALGKPIVFGPNMQNFADISRKFVERNAARRVTDAADLEKCLDELLSSAETRETMGNEAVKVVQENLGAVERTAKMIVDHLKAKNLYVSTPLRST